MQAALRLVDTVGLLDPPLSALYLAFYQVGYTDSYLVATSPLSYFPPPPPPPPPYMQSLAFSVQMKEFLCKLQSDPETSALGALLCQRERLTAHTFHDPPAVEENTALLSTFEVCVRRSTTPLKDQLESVATFT